MDPREDVAFRIVSTGVKSCVALDRSARELSVPGAAHDPSRPPEELTIVAEALPGVQAAAPRRATLATAIAGTHRQSSRAPIVLANEHGAFGHAGVSTVFPMVVDANVLRDELLRTVRKDDRTILCNAANGGVLRLFCAEHVIEEVERHAAGWALSKHVDPASVRDVWEATYLPLLRVVAIPAGLTTSIENEGLSVLADPASPYGDPDDVPTATLALLLAAPLLSRDRNPLRAVYGPEVNHVSHAQWLGALAAGGDLGPLSVYLQMSTMAIYGLGKASVSAFRALAQRVPWEWIVAAGAGTAGLASLLLEPATKRRLGAGVGQVLGSAVELFGEISVLHSGAQRQFATLAAPTPSWDDIADDLTAEQCLRRSCLHALARSPKSDLSAAELRDSLQACPGEARIRSALRTDVCFEQTYAGRFQVGPALMRVGALDQPSPGER
jgi:predicted nucleic acid-binding protein